MDSSRLLIPFAGMPQQRQITPEEPARRSPPGVAMPSDNLWNLLELSTIFYVAVLCLAAA